MDKFRKRFMGKSCFSQGDFSAFWQGNSWRRKLRFGVVVKNAAVSMFVLSLPVNEECILNLGAKIHFMRSRLTVEVCGVS